MEVTFSVCLLDGVPLSLPILTAVVKMEDKMSINSLEEVTDTELKKRVNELIDLDNWADKCVACGKPDLLHRGT